MGVPFPYMKFRVSTGPKSLAVTMLQASSFAARNAHMRQFSRGGASRFLASLQLLRGTDIHLFDRWVI
jgi:hypothetical protein